MCIGFFIGILYEKIYDIIRKQYCLILALIYSVLLTSEEVSALLQKTPAKTLIHCYCNRTRAIGGSDPGKISTSGVMEKDVNLSIAMALKQLFENRGFTVVMTRTTDCDLAPDNSKHPKTDDLTKRTALMSKSNVAVSISIHQNSFEDSSSCGPQVFYYEASDAGKELASSVLGALNTSLCVAKPRSIKPNKEYFILKKSTSPTVIVECGFLSNPAETLLLTDKNYQDDLAHAIYIGVTDYLVQSPSGHLQ